MTMRLDRNWNQLRSDVDTIQVAITTASVSRGAQWRGLGPAGVFCASLALLLLTIPGNEAESDDGFDFAYAVENGSYLTLFRRYHLLYLPFMKALYSLLQSIGVAARAHEVMVVLNVIFASATLTLFFLLLRDRLHLQTGVALLGTALLGFSYGFWRYAPDPKSYALANLVSVAVLYVALSPDRRPVMGPLLSALACAAICVDAQSAALACVVVPGLLLWRRDWTNFATYAVCSTVLLLGAYSFAAFWMTGDLRTFLFAPEGVSRLDLTTVPRAALGFAQDVVATPFLFGVAGFTAKVAALAPVVDLDYEMYTASVNGPAPMVLGFISASVLLVLVATSIVVFVRSRLRSSGTVALIWLLAYLPPVVITNPTGKELWVMALIPWWLWLTESVVDPLFRSGAKALLLTIVVVLGVHNFWAGMAMMRNPEGNLYRAESKWLLAHAGPGDLVLSYDKGKFTRFLRYNSNTQVVNLFVNSSSDLPALRASVEHPSGAIYVMQSVFEPPASVCRSSFDQCAFLRQFGSGLNWDTEVVSDDATGKVFLARGVRAN